MVVLQEFDPVWQLTSPNESGFLIETRGPRISLKCELNFPLLRDRIARSYVLWGQFCAYLPRQFLDRSSVGDSVLSSGSFLGSERMLRFVVLSIFSESIYFKTVLVSSRWFCARSRKILEFLLFLMQNSCAWERPNS